MRVTLAVALAVDVRLPLRAGQRRVDDVVLEDLVAALAHDLAQLPLHLLRVLLALADPLDVEVVQGDAPLEQRGEQRVVDRLAEVERVPLLLARHPEDAVADVVVVAEHVGELVVHVVVRVLPLLGRLGGVPLPVAGVYENKETYDRLVAALQGEISQKEIALHQAKDKLTVTILDRILFPSGQATLTPEGEQLIEKVGAILVKVAGQRILIEGHTDNVPIGATLSTRFPSNWELSSARAAEVVKYLISRVQLSPQQLSAVGRADTSPVASNTNEEGRRLNRRIEIIVLPLETQS